MNSSRINKLLSKKHVLVTGASGFIGSHLLRRLLRENCRVSIMARSSSDFWRIEDIKKDVAVFNGDLTGFDAKEFLGHFGDVKIIFHLGADGVGPNADDFENILKTNALGTLKLLELGRSLKVERFFYCGSCFEYCMPNKLEIFGLNMPLPTIMVASAG